jgi:very-short-patch-repair endonuclease
MYDTESFIKEAKKIHGEKYNYSLVNYKNVSTKIRIICSKHNVFEQTPKNHILRKSGCPKCAIEYKANKLKLSQTEFIIISNKTHSNKYNYSLVNYFNNKTHVDIICPIHGVFEQAPAHHMRGIGCPICNDSKGELKIKSFLNKNRITYIRNKMFNNCKDIGKLKFDFYLPNLNIMIEFDGIQHFKPNHAFGGTEEFNNIQRRDNIKNKYCDENLIQLIRIRYNENIENKLNFLI